MRWRLALVALALPALAAAQNKCPWLNQATAGGVLGGEVSRAALKVSKTGDSGSCEFVRNDASLSRTLLIEVDKSSSRPIKEQCSGQVQPLKAIGNEAVACSFEGKSGETAEQVVGRVRDQLFLVRVSSNDKTAAASLLREKARKVAEQVAGSLF